MYNPRPRCEVTVAMEEHPIVSAPSEIKQIGRITREGILMRYRQSQFGFLAGLMLLLVASLGGRTFRSDKEAQLFVRFSA